MSDNITPEFKYDKNSAFQVKEYGRSEFNNKSLSGGYLIGYVMSGGFYADEPEYRKKFFNAGQAFALKVNEGCRRGSNERNCVLYALVDGSFVRDLFAIYCIDSVNNVCSSKELKIITDIVESFKEIDGDNRKAAFCIHRIVKFLSESEDKSKDGNPVSTADVIRKYIEANAAKKLTLTEMENIFFVSKTQIFRVFKDTYGIAPMQYFLQRKIDLAKRMLSETDRNISEIANELSFSDAKHFTKTFKKITGILPREYRKG